MDKSTVTLLLGVTLAFAVVGMVIGFSLLMTRAQSTAVVLGQRGYHNEEQWSVVKDNDGRVRGITVHRNATEQ